MKVGNAIFVAILATAAAATAIAYAQDDVRGMLLGRGRRSCS